MRLLTSYELDLVAGGTTSEDYITVSGPDPWDYNDPPENDGNPDGAGGVGGGNSGPPTDQPPEDEIVVNGIRQDPADRDEVLLERQWTANGGFPAGKWANAEYSNGTWTITAASAPTQDQKDFKSNFDKVSAALWSDLSNNQQISLASNFTDLHVDLAGRNIDIGYAYLHYKGLLSSGEVQGGGSLDFATWVANGGR